MSGKLPMVLLKNTIIKHDSVARQTHPELRNLLYPQKLSLPIRHTQKCAVMPNEF